MQMGMQQQVLSPGMQDHGEANPCPQSSRVASQCQKGGRSCLEQQGVESSRVLEHQGMKQIGQRQHDVEVRNGEQALQASFEPDGSLNCLALGAMAISAGVISDANVPAGTAVLDMATQSSSATLHQMSHHLRLFRREWVTVTILAPVGTENVRDFEFRSRHGSLLPSVARGEDTRQDC